MQIIFDVGIVDYVTRRTTYKGSQISLASKVRD